MGPDKLIEEAQEFFLYIVRALVQYPDEAHVLASQDSMGILFSLRLNPADMGKIIGRQGQNAAALRTILNNYGFKKRARISLKIEEPTVQGGGSSADPLAELKN